MDILKFRNSLAQKRGFIDETFSNLLLPARQKNKKCDRTEKKGESDNNAFIR